MDPSLKASSDRTFITPESEIVDHLLELSKKRLVKEDMKEEGSEGSVMVFSLETHQD